MIALLDPDGFDVGEFSDAVDSEFPTVPGPFYAAERKALVGGDHAVHEDHSGVDIADQAFAFLVVIRPDAGTEAEAGVVGDPNGFAEILRAEQTCHRAKEFLGIRGRVLRNFR